MSDERETPAVPDGSAHDGAVHDPGAPIEEQSVTDDAVKDAVDRAAAIREDGSGGAGSGATGAEQPAPALHPADAEAERAAAAAEAAELAHREEVSRVDTELNLDTAEPKTDAAHAADTRIAALDELPSAAAAPAPAAADAPVRDGEIRISADHPMAALYMQSPIPPDLGGNRGAGVLIALLGAIAFAVLYAGLLAISIATTFPPSTFLSEGLLPLVTSWGFIAAVASFFVGLSILVLVFGRAGWWAYVIFSLFVGVFVWGATAGFSVLEDGFGGFHALLDGVKGVGLTLPVLGAAILAREVAIWFGAWIGARGRKVKARNTELLAEYEAALAEVRAQQ